MNRVGYVGCGCIALGILLVISGFVIYWYSYTYESEYWISELITVRPYWRLALPQFILGAVLTFLGVIPFFERKPQTEKERRGKG